MSLEYAMVTMAVVTLAMIAVSMWYATDPIKQEVKILVVS